MSRAPLSDFQQFYVSYCGQVCVAGGSCSPPKPTRSTLKALAALEAEAAKKSNDGPISGGDGGDSGGDGGGSGGVSLDLSDSIIGNAGAAALLGALQHYNPAAEEGGAAAATGGGGGGDSFAVRRCLWSLLLPGNALQNEAVEALVNFATGSHLMRRAAAAAAEDDEEEKEASEKPAEKVEKVEQWWLPRLSVIDLSNNEFIAVTSGIALLEMVSRCPQIQTVRLGGTNVPPHYVRRINAVCERNAQQAAAEHH